MQEERNRLRYVVSHSSMLTFIMSVYDVGRPHQSRVLADLPALQSRQLSDLASVLLMEGVVLVCERAAWCLLVHLIDNNDRCSISDSN